jgi:cysteine desulfurase/selenocysteine lyase
MDYLQSIISQFPIMERYPSLAYLDNAATTQKPQSVIDRMQSFYAYENANIHRGVYDLSNQATESYEAVRLLAAQFLGSNLADSIAFTKGTTEGINIIAQSFVKNRLSAGDNIVITLMEHHANWVPWQVLAKSAGVELRVVPLDKNLDIDISAFEKMVDHRTRIAALTHISNTVGTINPILELIRIAKAKEVPVLIDAAQSVALYDVSCQDFEYDFLVCSGHKMFGPMGVGILYAHPRHHEAIAPYNLGGGIIREVGLSGTTFATYPHHLDAGTPNVAGVLSLGTAIQFLNTLDRYRCRQHIHDLTQLLEDQLRTIPEVQILGSPLNRTGILSFKIDGIHPHDVASWLNQDQIAVRAGQHCTQPLLDTSGFGSAVRVSFSIYNSQDHVYRTTQSIRELINFWS